MDDDELHARFAGLRFVLAFAIKVASGNPAGINHNLAALRDLEALIPPALHPAFKDELEGVIAALGRLPRHGREETEHHAHASPRPRATVETTGVSPDLLS